MRLISIILVMTCMVIGSQLLLPVNGIPFLEEEDLNQLKNDDSNIQQQYNNYDTNDEGLSADKRSPSIYVIRRSCIRRGGNCDHRPLDCCHNSSCRCNLWGTNCRCQRVGLFQKWG